MIEKLLVVTLDELDDELLGGLWKSSFFARQISGGGRRAVVDELGIVVERHGGRIEDDVIGVMEAVFVVVER